MGKKNQRKNRRPEGATRPGAGKSRTAKPAGKPVRIRLDGVDWNARCATPGDALEPGQTCRVTGIHSTLLIVEPVLTESSIH